LFIELTAYLAAINAGSASSNFLLAISFFSFISDYLICTSCANWIEDSLLFSAFCYSYSINSSFLAASDYFFSSYSFLISKVAYN
jgi:hypothetical protein